MVFEIAYIQCQFCVIVRHKGSTGVCERVLKFFGLRVQGFRAQDFAVLGLFEKGTGLLRLRDFGGYSCSDEVYEAILRPLLRLILDCPCPLRPNP